jgi:hypothetical protein
LNDPAENGVHKHNYSHCHFLACLIVRVINQFYIRNNSWNGINVGYDWSYGLALFSLISIPLEGDWKLQVKVIPRKLPCRAET